jgi:hypothetical protein
MAERASAPIKREAVREVVATGALQVAWLHPFDPFSVSRVLDGNASCDRLTPHCPE